MTDKASQNIINLLIDIKSNQELMLEEHNKLKEDVAEIKRELSNDKVEEFIEKHERFLRSRITLQTLNEAKIKATTL